MAHPRGSRTLVRAPRRPMFWEGASVFDQVATGAVSSFVIVSEAILENIPLPTVIRTRGEFVVRASAIGASGAQAIFSMGLIIQSARSIAAGVGGMPVPFGGIGSDWFVHRMIPMQVEMVANEDSNQHNVRFEIDSKAMRKVDNNQGIVIVFQNTAVASTVTFEVVGALRLLFKR